MLARATTASCMELQGVTHPGKRQAAALVHWHLCTSAGVLHVQPAAGPLQLVTAPLRTVAEHGHISPSTTPSAGLFPARLGAGAGRGGQQVPGVRLGGARVRVVRIAAAQFAVQGQGDGGGGLQGEAGGGRGAGGVQGGRPKGGLVLRMLRAGRA